MKLTLAGAAGTVTGACFLLETEEKKILIDCGMFQGRKKVRKNNLSPFPFSPSEIDFLLLSHAHIDHCGLIPKLVKEGFGGKIFATKATCDLCNILLPDSAHIQEEDANWKNRKRARAGEDPIEPLYTMPDAIESLRYFNPVSHNELIDLSSHISARFKDAGHILGSSIVELWVKEKGKEHDLVFSGDLGSQGQRIVRDPQYVRSADFLLLETTYGDRLHRSRAETIKEFKEILLECFKTQGNVVIPSFAVERTQEIIYELGELLRKKLIPEVPIFIDSPLAISATEIFKKNPQCFDRETLDLLTKGESPLNLPNLRFSRTVEESKAINGYRPAIIISASGMCDAGRILHHLKHNIWRENSHIVFVGYQAHGSLGRRIIEGAKKIRIFREDIVVKAHIHTLGGFSAHADQKELLDWVSKIKASPEQIFLVHGENKARQAMKTKLKEVVNAEIILPVLGSSYELT